MLPPPRRAVARSPFPASAGCPARHATSSSINIVSRPSISINPSSVDDSELACSNRTITGGTSPRGPDHPLLQLLRIHNGGHETQDKYNHNDREKYGPAEQRNVALGSSAINSSSERGPSRCPHDVSWLSFSELSNALNNRTRERAMIPYSAPDRTVAAKTVIVCQFRWGGALRPGENRGRRFPFPRRTLRGIRRSPDAATAESSERAIHATDLHKGCCGRHDSEAPCVSIEFAEGIGKGQSAADPAMREMPSRARRGAADHGGSGGWEWRAV